MKNIADTNRGAARDYDGEIFDILNLSKSQGILTSPPIQMQGASEFPVISMQWVSNCEAHKKD